MLKKRAPKEQLDAILNALEESLLEASDEQILEDVTESGEDIKEIEARIKNILRDATIEFKKKRLQEASVLYMNENRPIGKHRLIPESFREKLDFLVHIVESHPQIKTVLTAQYRKFAELTEEDVDSCLDELAKLGVLDELYEGKK